MSDYNNPQRYKNGDSGRFYLKDKGIWIFCLALFGINGIVSIFNKDYYYLVFSILTIGFISSNVLIVTKPQKFSIIIQLLMIISLFMIKIMKIENSKLLITFCILSIIIYGYILIKQIIGGINNEQNE